jgi:hypothetical protein
VIPFIVFTSLFQQNSTSTLCYSVAQKVVMPMTKEYLLLFNAVTDAIKALQDLQLALMTAQQTAEELFLERTD